jgi:hypothetical protein
MVAAFVLLLGSVSLASLCHFMLPVGSLVGRLVGGPVCGVVGVLVVCGIGGFLVERIVVGLVSVFSIIRNQ